MVEITVEKRLTWFSILAIFSFVINEDALTFKTVFCYYVLLHLSRVLSKYLGKRFQHLIWGDKYFFLLQKKAS